VHQNTAAGVLRNPAVRYTGPFAAFMTLLYLSRAVVAQDLVVQILFVAAMAAIIYLLSWPVVDFQIRRPGPTAVLGILVFLLWIAPEWIDPNYRRHWLFDNPLIGQSPGSLSSLGQAQPGTLLFRSLRAVVIVPIAEELFWRGWLMRWLIDPKFESVPLGTWAPAAFWITAALFAAEHAARWDVGLMAGIFYNWWIIRTRSLGDVIFAHAITNGLLCAYIIAYGKWEFW
jgi:CAAX prenyl protease-like protein